MSTFCQSCGMPLENQELLGTEKDGSKNGEHCIYCYKDGAYTADITMDQMIEGCAKYMVENNPDMDEKQAKEQMRKFFPTLKRWKQN